MPGGTGHGGWHEAASDNQRKRIQMHTYIDVQTRQCSLIDSQIPGAVDQATPSDGSWEREPSRDVCYTLRVTLSLCAQ